MRVMFGNLVLFWRRDASGFRRSTHRSATGRGRGMTGDERRKGRPLVCIDGLRGVLHADAFMRSIHPARVGHTLPDE